MKKGFTLIELLCVVVVLAIIFLFSIPIIKVAINNSKLGTFEASVQNVIDAVDNYIAMNKFVALPNEGIEISDLDASILSNNNFDDGVVVRRDSQTEIVYIKQGDYCAKGTKDKLKATNKGCGALDETAPTKADLFVKNTTKNSIVLVAEGYDKESVMTKYELSVDGGKYFTNKPSSYNVFEVEINDNKEHTFKLRVTNEGGLTLESSEKKFKLADEQFILMEENNSKGIQSGKDIVFTKNIEEQRKNEEVKYEYSIDGSNWETIEKLSVIENGTYFIRKIDGFTTTYNTLNINNIDTVLNGAFPVLDTNMVPIIYEGGKWIIADKNQIYYDYYNRIWANAAIVRKNSDLNDNKSHSREYYLSNEAIGTEIYEKDLMGYYVWIPRFSYAKFNNNGNNPEPMEINIQFEDNTVTDTSNTHNAFLYENTNGFWVSKYEASANNTSNCYLNANPANCNNNAAMIELYNLPNRNSLQDISIGNAYDLTKNLNKHYNKYGFSTNTNTHLMTNLEWGAIAYLASSQYGNNSNVTIETTTSNETGVYDMGTNPEFVMGNYSNTPGGNKKLNSGFVTYGKVEWPETYIDIYNSVSTKGRILGDATLETEEWYNNTNNFVTVDKPFLVRGTNSIYDFYNVLGSYEDHMAFRPTLVVYTEDIAS